MITYSHNVLERDENRRLSNLYTLIRENIDVKNNTDTTSSTVEFTASGDSGALDTVIDAAELGELIHVLRTYYQSLPPEQQVHMLNYFTDRISPPNE